MYQCENQIGVVTLLNTQVPLILHLVSDLDIRRPAAVERNCILRIRGPAAAVGPKQLVVLCNTALVGRNSRSRGLST